MADNMQGEINQRKTRVKILILNHHERQVIWTLKYKVSINGENLFDFGVTVFLTGHRNHIIKLKLRLYKEILQFTNKKTKPN